MQLIDMKFKKKYLSRTKKQLNSFWNQRNDTIEKYLQKHIPIQKLQTLF